MGRVTDLAPAGMVPAAWLLTIAAHAALVSDRTLLIGLGVMDVLLVAFAAASSGEMTGPVLSAWRQVLLVGLLANLLGTADLLVDPASNPALPVTLYAWFLLPAVAYVRTGRETVRSPYRQAYLAAAALTLLGTAAYSVAFVGIVDDSVATVGGLAVVGGGQTVGIVAAAVQNGG
ncbi:hypothetical protein [Halorientalis marina]|uniref:hypothetical protein n=1 Tax=Halorientalis marina TaxID=2931976 RepID=UPI001FF244EC|nr:hypothetical protein [Halorientalis marina]